MHLHLVQFQILQRQGFNAAALHNGTLELIGSPRAPQANEAGWKDMAVVNPKETLTILIRFEGYTGRYVFHCHMLEHEDNDMMRPYEVTSDESKAPRELARHQTTLTAPSLWEYTDRSPTTALKRE